ncbi:MULTISPECIES: TetR/AcrR family transcriptional regulator [Streptomyces]|uniref:AcrR family transcriptional regulator n=2 Tax=Streptomyces TaxID=1883 RepID=A0ABT9L061_9ACTN|nr:MULTISPECIES: TetR/AcrR family transcriptional regulator [Streptomyces]MBW8088712.1 TetR/AcrR family transcriptional regulator [Streptomyces hygroscopicus subsp. hygroscopicus]MCO8304171.1 TetR/AcrR family transcriptional regulator [Streptomyces sp. RKCA744]MDP9613775.1 AcrR family transcriptional regulator [Streptomyces demainii]GHJ31627.1 TetR family transcriptional regulator [Streptomyces hygroscopicus]
MGHREDLLAGAKRCLQEKGWSRTTARDIVAVSGANLASIGYHYGSKDALMREALFAAMSDWADDVERSLEADAATRDGQEDDPAERFETRWTRVLELFDRHQAVWRSQLEAILQVQHDPELREAFGRAQPEGRQGLVAILHGIDESEVDEETARVMGSFYMALVSGMVVQMTINPDLVPSAHDLVEAMRRIVGGTPAAPAG